MMEMVRGIYLREKVSDDEMEDPTMIYVKSIKDEIIRIKEKYPNIEIDYDRSDNPNVVFVILERF